MARNRVASSAASNPKAARSPSWARFTSSVSTPLTALWRRKRDAELTRYVPEPHAQPSIFVERPPSTPWASSFDAPRQGRYEPDGSGDSDSFGSMEPAGDPDAAGADAEAAGTDAEAAGVADGAAEADGAVDAAGAEAAGAEAPAEGTAEPGASVGPNVQPAPAVLEPVVHAWVTMAASAMDATAASRARFDMDRCMRKSLPQHHRRPSRTDRGPRQSAGSSFSDAELMQYRSPVGFGPSSNT
jgi:hypothetical protein